MNKERVVQALLLAGFILLRPASAWAQSQPGSFVEGFNPGLGIQPGETISGVVIQDTNLIVVGSFTSFNGSPWPRVLRLLPNGSADLNFRPGSGANGDVVAAAVSTDLSGQPSHIYVGGRFRTFDGFQRNRLARLGLDGAIDPSFDPGKGGEGPDGDILCLAPLASGILVGGEFIYFNQYTCPSVARISTEGVVDSDFADRSWNSSVYTSTRLRSHLQSVRAIERWHSDSGLFRLGGELGWDRRLCTISAFGFLQYLEPLGTSVAIGAIEAIASIPSVTYIGGTFSSGSYRGLYPIYADVAPFASLVSVSALAFDEHERLWVAGTYATGAARFTNAIRRYFSDGVLDRGFNTNLVYAGTVTALRATPGGGVIAAGSFQRLGDRPAPGIAKLHSTIIATTPLVITRQPEVTYDHENSRATIAVEVSASPEREPVYRWRLRGSVLPDKTNAILVLNPVKPSDFGDYQVEVTRYRDSVTSAIVSLGSRPTILVPPTSQTVLVGASVTLSVTATGVPPPLYQWFRDVTLLPGATNHLLTVNGITTNQAGAYVCYVMTPLATVISPAAMIAVHQIPVFLQQPVSQTVGRYSNVTFTASVDSLPTARLQWLFNGQPIAGATNDTLTLSYPQSADSGAYTLMASNIAGVAVSDPAILTVVAFPPVILRQSSNEIANEGYSTALSVDVTGTPPFTYEWSFEGKLIQNSDPLTFYTSDYLSIYPTDLTNAGTYSVTIRNEAGAVTSEPMTLNVDWWPPQFTIQPAELDGVGGQTVVFQSEANGAPPPIYQWYRDGQRLANATNAELTLRDVQPGHSGDYWNVAINPYGAATSHVAHLQIQPAPLNAGAVHLAFQPELTNEFGSSLLSVRAIAIDRLGRILVSGQNAIIRLQPNGAVDPTFSTNSQPDGSVQCFAVQPDGRIVIGGTFGEVGGEPHDKLARLHEDGTVDSSFMLPEFYSSSALFGSFVSVNSLRILKNGDILHTGGTYLLGRVDSFGQRVSGSFDLKPGYTSSPVASYVGYDVAIESSGTVLVSYNSYPVRGNPEFGEITLSRHNKLGAIDTAFRAFGGLRQFGAVFSLVPLLDQKILVGGSFTNSMARLHRDGSIDPTFVSPFSQGWNQSVQVRSIVPLSDGRILVGGSFRYAFAGRTNFGIARLHADGRMDETFDPWVGLQRGGTIQPMARAISIQADGHVLVGGDFDSYGNVPRPGFAQLNSDPPVSPQILRHPSNVLAPLDRPAALFAEVSFPFAVKYQWFKDDRERVGATNQLLNFSGLRQTDAGAYYVVVSNDLGSATSAVATVSVAPTPTTPGSPRIGAGSDVGTDRPVFCSTRLADGRILVGGNFRTVGGLHRPGLAALKPDGTVDPDFGLTSMQLGAAASSFREGIAGIAEDARGRIYVIGNFIGLSGVPRYGIARLKRSGEVDLAFNANVSSLSANPIRALAVRRDDRIVVAGDSVTINGRAFGRWGALNETGGVETTYSTVGLNSSIGSLALRPDGLALVTSTDPPQTWAAPPWFQWLDGPGGLLYPPSVAGITYQADFLTLLRDGSFGVAGGRGGGPPFSKMITLLRPSGAANQEFGSQTYVLGGFDNTVHAMAQDSCRRLVIAGTFTNVNGTARRHLARLLPDGTVDSTFTTGSGIDGTIYTLQVLADDSVFVGGNFSAVDGVTRPGFAFLHGDPTVPPVIVSEPRGGRMITGPSAKLMVEVDCAPSLTYQWFRDGQRLPAETNTTLDWPVTVTTHSGEYVVVVSNPAGTITSSVARVVVDPPVIIPGRPDWEFFAGRGPDARIRTMVVDSQNRLVIGGQFTNVDGQPRPMLARLDAHGRLDPGFAPLTNHLSLGFQQTSLVRDCRFDTLGRLLVAGRFSLGPTQQHLVRVLDNGQIDPEFSLGLSGPFDWPAGLARMLPLADGSVIVVGAGQGATRRILPNGRLDPSPGFRYGFSAEALALGADGRWLAAGGFTVTDSHGATQTTRTNLARFHADGTLDGSFDAGPINGAVLSISIVPDPDGRIIVSGFFSQVAGRSRPGIARLHHDGRIDETFLSTWPWPSNTVSTVQALPGGKTLLAGRFFDPNGGYVPLARVREDGAVDPDFDPTAWYPSADLDVVAVSRWGTIYGAGDFPLSPRPYFAQFHGDPTLVVQSVEGPEVRLEAWTVTGRSYQLETLDQLGLPAWQPVSTLPGNGTVQSWSLAPAPASETHRYFRLRVE